MKVLKLPTNLPDFLTWWKGITGGSITDLVVEGADYIVWLLNSAYIDGLNRREGYPEDPDEEAAAFAEDQGEELTDETKQMVTSITKWRNRAYRVGRHVAEKEAEA